MALSLSSFINPIALLFFATVTQAATRTYDFNITWTTANPDGVFERSVIGINNQWPIPTLRADVGDQLVVNVFNGLGNVSTALHFHGMFQNGTTHMDGPASVTQCGIAPGSSFTYNFTVCKPCVYKLYQEAKLFISSMGLR
jgi:iron transport multicopper oxidase